MRSDKMKKLDAVEEYVNKQISIEKILNSLIELDKMKSIMFSANELMAMNMIDIQLIKNSNSNYLVFEPWDSILTVHKLTEVDIENVTRDFSKENLSTMEERILSLFNMQNNG